MENLHKIIVPQLQLIRNYKPLEIPERVLTAEQQEDLYTVYGAPVSPVLPLCEMCHQPHGGTQHGWLKKAHGPETNWKPVEVPCPMCSPSAIALQLEEKARKSQVVLEEIFGSAQIPWHAKLWEFSNFPKDGDQDSLQIVQEFVTRHLSGDETAKRGLYLGGQAGRGKTSLAISALKQVIRESQQPCLFVMSMELMDRLRATYSSNKEHQGAITYDELINAVCSVTWLVLDDLAVEKPTTYVLEKLYYIVEKRRSLGLYTIITSNLSTKALEAYWRPEGTPEGGFHPGIRIVERIREYCEGIGFKGKNLREGNW
jgi:DNA replication protein DnaC